MIWRFLATHRSQSLGIAVALLAPAANCGAAPIRVTTWDLRPNAAVGATGWSPSFQQSLIQEAATTLAEIKPDVILLQQAANWETCNQLAKALRPLEYNVAVCSSFRDPRTGAPARQQVAIFAKAKPYISWPDSWHSESATSPLPGGIAFAAIQVAGHNIGFFSVQFGDDGVARTDNARAGREEAAAELVKQITALGNWTTNRLESLLVGGSFNTTGDDPLLRAEQTLPRLEALGFDNAFEGVPFSERVTLPANSRRPDATVDYIFNKGGRPIGPPLISRGALTEHCAVTYQVDFSLPPIVRAELAGSAAPAKTNAAGARFLWLAMAGGLTLIVVGASAIRLRRARQTSSNWQLARSSTVSGISVPNASTIVVTAPDRQGVVAEISRWAKEKLVQRLISDRSELMATQQTAARKVMEVDERLSKIERQIQKRRLEYERRIDELLKELATAKEENRELIEAKIALIKVQMEQDRVKT